MGLKKHNNRFGELVDDVYDLVLYESQLNSTMASSIRMVTIYKLSTPCGVYIIENNTTLSIPKKGGRNEYWGISPLHSIELV